jgi:flagellar biosynthesis GTPase FlhF
MAPNQRRFLWRDRSASRPPLWRKRFSTRKVNKHDARPREGEHMSDERKQAKHALKQASSAARRGDRAEAERWSKIAERLTATAERLAALPPEENSWEEDEKMREEIRGRIARLCAIDREIREWEYEAEIHAAYTERAAREGLPPAPPLRPRPHTEGFLEQYIQYCFSEDKEPPKPETGSGAEGELEKGRQPR